MPDMKQLTEEDIKLRCITPAIQKKWKNENILMEAQITAGRINLTEKVVKRDRPKKADYLLLLRPNHPIAVVEAKDNKHSVSHGMQQAKEYAKMLDVPFAYSSNGDAFEEFDAITGKEREIPLGEFPSPEELYQRYKNEKGLTSDEEKIINQPYYTSQSTNAPRYYQRVAINRTLDAIARGQNRILLVMATGTGKTYTAFQIVYRLIKSGLRHKVLYLADRNILVDQSISQDFKPLEKTIHKINFTKDDPTAITSYEVYFSLYQQLAVDSEEEDDEQDSVVNAESETDDETVSRLAQLFRPNFFDLVIVDECHRGSAKKDSSWRKILDYFSSATQIGMTATPKETKYVSNIDYFGEPVYTYSLRAGIEDGFLAPFRVINVKTSIGEGWRPKRGQKDKYGKEIEDRIYTNKDFDYNIVLEDRTRQVAEEITKYLRATGRMQKTIVFCATEDHAERMRAALANLNADMVRENPDYVVRITGGDAYGKSKLDYFISVSSEYPVIATTSKLLSTGVDCKMTKLIVLDQMISSMTTFKQIIGRGTRIREYDGKTYFVVMDFRNVTRLFADPDWDGPVEQTDGFDPDAEGRKNPMEPGGPDGEKKQHPIVDADGCSVQVTDKAVQLFDPAGKLVREESITDYAKSTILGTYSNLDDFISKWSAEEKKYVIRQNLLDRGIDIGKIKKDMDMDGVSDYDFICHLAFNAKPVTRKERADRLKKRDFLKQYSGPAREVLEELLLRYEDEGVYELEKPEVLKLPQFARFGKPAKIAQLFGGKGGYHTAIKKLETELYNDSGAEHK